MQRELSLIEEQALKSARFSHRLLLTVCFAGLIFGFSPQERSVYKNAVKELNTLLSLDVRELILNAALENNKFNQSYLKVKSILSDYGLSLLMSQSSDTILLIKPDPLNIPDETLDNINEYLTRLSELSLTVTKFDKEFEEDLRNLLNKGQADYPTGGKTVVLFVHSDILAVLYCKEVYFTGCSVSRDIRYSLRHSPAKENITVPFDVLSVISESPELRHLVTEIKGDYLFLPSLKRVWDQIRSEVPIQARAILARKDIPQEKRLKVFGLSIPQYLVSWTIPLLIFALSIYFLIHTTHLSVILNNNPDIRKYPWVVIMPGRLAAVLSTTTLCVLPILTLISIAHATWSGQTILLRILSIALFVGTVITLMVAIAKISAIKKPKNSL